MTTLRIVALVACSLAVAGTLCRALAWLYTPQGGDTFADTERAGHFEFMARGAFRLALMLSTVVVSAVAVEVTR